MSELEFGKPEKTEEESMTGYREAPESFIDLAKDIINKRHKHLEQCRILYLVTDEELKYRGKIVPGRVYKVHDREKTELKKDIELVISEPVYEQCVEQNNKEAAIDFLLCFIAVSSEAGTWTTKDPDFYGFYNNVDEYGMWDRDLKNLQKRLKQTKIPFEN